MTGCMMSCRREFLRQSLAGGLATLGSFPLVKPVLGSTSENASPAARVALTSGDDRADNVFRGMTAFRDQIAKQIGDRPVIIKPNNVAIDVQLSATHAEFLEGILEFLRSINKLDRAVIAESAATGPTLEGFDNYGYTDVAKKYGVKLIDFDDQESAIVHVVDETDFRPRAVRMSPMLLDRNNYIISAAKLKTHDLVVATLSLKNIVLGAPVKDPGFRWSKGRSPGHDTQKPIVHGGGAHGINYNLFALARRLHPDLAVIDGYDGMEGNGPVQGSAVDHRVSVVSPDWLAADRVGVELMGIDFAKIGYLNYCARGGLGQADLEKIEVIDQPIARHKKSYKLASNIEKQLVWQNKPFQS